MKKILLTLIFASFGTGAVFSQALTNGGFENWVNSGSYDDPTGYVTFNVLSSSFLGSNPLSVFKETSIVHSGSAACKIRSVKLTSNPDPTLIPDTVGVAFTGQVIAFPSFSLKPGFPFVSRPQDFEFWARYTPAGNDTAYGFAALTKWNGTSRDTVAVTWINVYGTIGTYTQYTTPFIYNQNLPSNTYPDTAVVLFSATDDLQPQVGSEFWVDDASFSGWVGVETQSGPDLFKTFPVPANDELNITTSEAGNYTLTIFDMSGKACGTYEIKGGKMTINLSALPAGTYSFNIRDSRNTLMKQDKFSIVR